MQSTGKKIRLIATDIEFKTTSIIYTVKTENNEIIEGQVFCLPNINDKDLVLKSNYISKDNMTISFIPINVTTPFYLKLLNGSLKNLDEYEIEKQAVYLKGEAVGFIVDSKEQL